MDFRDYTQTIKKAKKCEVKTACPYAIHDI